MAEEGVKYGYVESKYPAFYKKSVWNDDKSEMIAQDLRVNQRIYEFSFIPLQYWLVYYGNTGMFENLFDVVILLFLCPSQ